MTSAHAMTTTTLAENALWTWWMKLNFGGYGYSTQSTHSDWLFFWVFLISAFFFILLMVLGLYFVFKYRRRPGQAPLRSRAHNTFLELTWSVIPTILLVWMFFEGFWGYASAIVPPSHAPEYLVQAQKWSWSLTYPNGAASPETVRTGSVDIPVFVVPENEPVSLRMHSTDVIHAFWVPDFRVKFDIFPNRYTQVWFEARRPAVVDPADLKPLIRTVRDDQGKVLRTEPWLGPDGKPYTYTDHNLFCAEYCGAMHSEMAAIIRVVPKDAFEAIIADWAEPRGDPVTVGAFLYKSKGCNSCHSVDGSRMVGPSWKDLFGTQRTFSNAPPTVADANYIRESLLDPSAKIVAGYPNQMPTQQGKLKENQIDALIAYMQSLSSSAPQPAAAPAEGAPLEPVPPEGVHPAAPTQTPGNTPPQPAVPPTSQQPPK